MHPTEEEISALIDQEIEEAQANLLLEHFKQCSRCAALYNQLSCIHSRLSHTPLPESSNEFVDGVMTRLTPITSEESPGWLNGLSGWLMPAVGVAFSLLLLLSQPFAEYYSATESTGINALLLTASTESSDGLFGFATLWAFQED